MIRNPKAFEVWSACSWSVLCLITELELLLAFWWDQMIEGMWERGWDG